ncbi:VOC family protein (plasmid) [Rhizobium sp. RCAM05350]|nr:VOC family protein [Rhizobium sp. RCAM05350]
MSQSRSENPAALAFNHIGVGVSDLESAVSWYTSVLGFRLISGPVDTRSDGIEGRQAHNVLGARSRHMRQAHLTSGNGIGLELFQLIDPPHERRPDEIEYWRSGIFHFCVTGEDVPELVARIKDAGGEQLSEIWPERNGETGYFMCYCRDPFGCVIEVYSHSYELVQGHR